MCWDVDEETHEGICVELCTGTAASPMCSNEAELDCATVNDSVLNVCLPACDPLLQACADDGVCVPAGSTFICMFDASNAHVAGLRPVQAGERLRRGPRVRRLHGGGRVRPERRWLLSAIL